MIFRYKGDFLFWLNFLVWVRRQELGDAFFAGSNGGFPGVRDGHAVQVDAWLFPEILWWVGRRKGPVESGIGYVDQIEVNVELGNVGAGRGQISV